MCGTKPRLSEKGRMWNSIPPVEPSKVAGTRVSDRWSLIKNVKEHAHAGKIKFVACLHWVWPDCARTVRDTTLLLQACSRCELCTTPLYKHLNTRWTYYVCVQGRDAAVHGMLLKHSVRLPTTICEYTYKDTQRTDLHQGKMPFLTTFAKVRRSRICSKM